MTTEEVEAKLQEFAALGEDWDSDGGLPPTEAALTAARALLAELPGPEWLAPIPYGGIQVDYTAGLEVDVGEDGRYWLLWLGWDWEDQEEWFSIDGATIDDIRDRLHEEAA